jgi:hypothetical protein
MTAALPSFGSMYFRGAGMVKSAFRKALDFKLCDFNVVF